MTACEEIKQKSTKMTNAKATNVTKNCPSKKTKDCYFAHGFINDDHITTDNCYYLLSLCKT